ILNYMGIEFRLDLSLGLDLKFGNEAFSIGFGFLGFEFWIDPFIDSQTMLSTSAHQQSLADVGSETRPSMLERDHPPEEQKEDLTGDDLKQYEANIKAINLILIFVPNDIYHSVDACENEKDMWDRVKRLMQAEESLTSVYNRFLQLINDLQRNNVTLPNVTINTKFLNCLQPKWYRHITNVRLANNVKDDSYDVLFDHL
nr:hypothetical protein [Tanacetum cinerariifolium]